MPNKLVLMLLILVFAASSVSGQAAEEAHLRVMQLSFLSSGSAVVDIRLDETPVFEAISFPFATDYVELAAGSHTLTTTIADEPDFSASTTLNLASGHHYSVIVEGDYREGVTFMLIDETDIPLEETGSAAIIANLTSLPLTEIAIDGERVVDSLPAGEYRSLSLPVTEFAISGRLAGRDYSESFNPHANTLFLVAVRLSPSGDPQVIYQRFSPLTIAAYLQSVDAGAQFSQIADWLSATGLIDSLPDDGEYTLFLPTNHAMHGREIPSNVDELRAMLSSHIIPQQVPPYALPGHEALITLGGGLVAFDFGATASGYWEVGGVPVLWDVRLANGVIYAIDGVIELRQ